MPTQRPVRIPLEKLFGGQANGGPQLSPDGKRLAYLKSDQGASDLVLRDLATGGQERRLLQWNGVGLYDYAWAMDGRTIIFREQGGGDENYQCQALDVETGERRVLTPAVGEHGQPVQALLGYQLNRNSSPLRPHLLLAAMNFRDYRRYDLYAIDVRSGARELLAEGSRGLRKWLVDAELNVRGALEETDDGGLSLAWRAKPQGEFAPLLAWPAEDEMFTRPLTVTPRGGLLLLDSAGRDTAALVEFDPAGGGRTVLLDDPEYDVDRIELDPGTDDLEAAWIARERRRWTVFSKPAAGDYARLEDEFAPGGLIFGSRSRDNRKWVVWSIQSDRPPNAYLFDRDQQKLEHLFAGQPELEQYEFAPKQPFGFDARDGLRLHGYLTEPRGFARPGPLVLLPHGGPWARDYDGFDPVVQWLANRGWACLQVDFRGSLGYGKRLVALAKREWGGRMQDDLTDAVGWAVGQGLADPRRVAIMGASYGGYAALAGAALTPGVYAGAVSLCGISNLLTMLENERPHWVCQRRRYETHVGRLPRFEAGERRGELKPEAEFTAAEAEEARYLKDRSPLFQARQVRCPVLMGHGANDPRCLADESEAFAAALRANGLDVQLAVYPDEGHWLADEEHRLDFYRRAEGFLGKVLA